MSSQKTQPARVLITGASSGIGAATAHFFADNGYSPILVGRDQKRLKQVQDSLSGTSDIFQCDLTKENEIKDLVKEVQALPQIELKALIHNAGVFALETFEKTNASEWQRQFQTSIMGPVELTLGVLSLLKKSSPSSVVMVSSTASLRPIPNTAAYSAMKAAMNLWMKCLALELAPENIRVNGVCPGIIDTPIHDLKNRSSDDVEFMNSLQPLKRVGQPEEIAKAVFFLAHNESSPWTTGSLLTVDGGITLQ